MIFCRDIYTSVAFLHISITFASCFKTACVLTHVENITGSLSENCRPTVSLDPPMAIYFIEFGQKKLSSRKPKKRKRKIWSESGRSEYPAL